jgi:mRNA interferase RelE/StbE
LHNVSLSKSAKEELRGIPERFSRQIAGKLRSLKDNPFPQGVKKLKGEDAYRIRSGDFRILYTVNGLDVLVYAIGNRKDVYR